MQEGIAKYLKYLKIILLIIIEFISLFLYNDSVHIGISFRAASGNYYPRDANIFTGGICL